MENDRFANKVALVTGGTKGIGASTALALLKGGARVAVVARSALRGNGIDVLADIDMAKDIRYVAADVSDVSAVSRAIDQVGNELGSIDILINNAAIVEPVGPSHKVDSDQWKYTLAVNVVGAFNCVREVLPGMLDKGWGRIVNITSIAGMAPGIMGLSAYSASKAALNQLTICLANEYGETGVAVCGFDPGPIDTSMQQTLRMSGGLLGKELSQKYCRLLDEGRLRSAEECGKAITRLVASGISGRIVRFFDMKSETSEE